MLNKLFGGKKTESKESSNGKGKEKKKGYYLDLEGNEVSPNTEEEVVVEETTTETAPTVEASEEKKEEKKEEPKTAKSSSSKKGKQTVAKAAKVEPSAPAEWDAPEWAKNLLKNSQKPQVEIPKNNTFATDYLMPTSTKTRRRPGPSMNKFMDMARQTKKPSSRG